MKTNRQTNIKRNKKRRTFFHRLRLLAILGCFAFILCSLEDFHPILASVETVQQLLQLKASHYSYKYDITTPKSYEEEELPSRLEELVAEYSEFQPILDNYNAYPTKLLSALCNNPEMIDFALGYLDADTSIHTDFSLKSSDLSEDNLPLLFQWDKRWGYQAFGDDTIGLSGCAPTCLSMVIYGLTGNTDATPATLAKYISDHDYYLAGTGTSWSVMTEGATHFGVTGKEIPLDEAVIANNLKDGHPIICSMAPGHFTTGGHFIVLTSYDNGKLTIHDPNSPYRSSIKWDYNTISGEIKNLWSFR